MNDNGYIVCGWYTPDYEPLARRLVTSLDALGEPHDIVAVESGIGGWEAQTMRKPKQILDATLRHPDKTIIFLDVDCEVVESLAPLADIKADIAVHIMVGKRSRGYGRLFCRTTTIVLQPTWGMRDFVSTWNRLSLEAPKGQVDQHTFTQAVAETPYLTVTHLPARWCAMDKDGIDTPAVIHSGASRGAKKIPGWLRAINTFTHSCRR